MFACVTQPSGMTFRTGVRGAEAYLKYEVSADANGIYQLEILNGRGATITPVIGMRFAAREDWSDDESGKSVIDIHIRGQRLIPERGCILRVILAMTFIISRIDRGIAPSLHRVFRTYRLS
jgi:hypothetical protein